MEQQEVFMRVCDVLRTLSDVVIDEKGRGLIHHKGHAIEFDIEFRERTQTVKIDLHFGLEFNLDFSQVEIFMGFYNDSSTVTHLVCSAAPKLRISYCADATFPQKEFILRLFESALEVWVMLLPGFERIQTEGLLLDPDMSPEGFDAMNFYEEITGNKLERSDLMF